MPVASASKRRESVSLKSHIGAAVDGYRAAAGATADLAAAELRLAASTAVLLVALAIVLALLASSAWILLMLSLAVLLTEFISAPLSLALVGLINLAAAAGCWIWIGATTPNLTFRGLRAVLADRRTSDADEEA